MFRRYLFLGILGILLSTLLVGVGGATTPAEAALTVRVINTDGQGVASRPGPHLSPTNGYGAPANATVVAQCWTWGDAVGPYVNRLWWLVSYAGRQFYVADRYLSTPNVANQPPAGQPQCGGSPPASSGTAPLVWLGSPVDGRWSTYEGAATHHRLGNASPTNDWAVDLEVGAGAPVYLYAAPQVSGVVITARVDQVGPSCYGGGGGRFVTVGLYAGSTRIGSATYAHINPTVSLGQTLNRWGSRVGTVGSYAYQPGCWEGAHVHFEMYSNRNYACFNKGFRLGQAVYRTNFLGFTGGNVASGVQRPCP
ncbi:hypothetical protein GCM10010531_39290 [Blastococcus jejuensis]|uniref:LasA protease n=1 Tax=Blastococcus jejuensis TaxID=351224 RepID=A0ABP6PKR3_9ACTN